MHARSITLKPLQRSRVLYASLAALVVGAGLFWRSGVLPLPDFASKYGGDALWALVVFLGLGFLCRGASTRWIAGGSLCLAWAVECLQLYHAGWIDGIRATLLGRLILGSTFNAPDLVAYAIGIALGALAEWVYRARAVQT